MKNVENENPLPSSRLKKVDNVRLIQCGILLALLYFLIAALSHYFDPNSRGIERPLLQIIVLLGVSFFAYCWSWKIVGGFGTPKISTGQTWMIVLLFGLLFRVIMVPSTPIQEIDIYRYIWDGAAVAEGVDPYLYSPKSIQGAIQQQMMPPTPPVGNGEFPSQTRPPLPPELTSLAKMASERRGAASALARVHFGEFTSPYPPVSQAVFAGVMRCVPRNANSRTCLIAMKAALALFDFGTLVVLVLLLKHAGRGTGLAVAYGWCPLTLKEIANSGHLDSIVVFFFVLTIYFAARAFFRPAGNSSGSAKDDSTKYVSWFSGVMSAIALALAISAKIIPIVAVPVLFCIALRKSIPLAITVTAVAGLLTAALMWPMARHMDATQNILPRETTPVLYSGTISVEPQGVEAFSKYWEMNDLLFMILVENFKAPTGDKSTPPWFRVTSDDFRTEISKPKEIADNGDGKKVNKLADSYPHFSLARKITLVIFALLVLWFCLSVIRKPNLENWLSIVFLSVAWFWMLAPTQNPWYWLWALPLVPFARNRIWFFVSGSLILYYLRFWFEYHFPNKNVLDTGYFGTQFFDFVVPWIEFSPILIGLILGGLFSLSKLTKGKPTS